ncbi:hypothetical protein ACFOOK_12000 [Micromonospora krabiensis]|uniref:Uncharacterized protein n=1 Tax=Micromonospora krabiensis TaxID=307121 RepID=A0A1C3N2M4_9ACTN|nr:hypothetical protein [Micromonospora krabiensis]SBV26843.1 hypothetical protein GA0070620_2340 [Micromonospora krabiensis]
MLPVAFACPLWWVARWAGRLLASLAVFGALTVGAGSAPGAPAAPAPTFAAVTVVAEEQGSAVPVSRRVPDTGSRDTGVRPATGAGAATVVTGTTIDGGAFTVADSAAAPHPDAVARTAFVPPPAATVGVPAAAHRPPTTTGPTPSAPRAPPRA